MDAKVDISNIVLETERLILRTWKQSDLQDFFEYASVDGVGECAGWEHHTDISHTQAILDRFILGKKTFAIVYKENGKVIGSLGIESAEREAVLDEEFKKLWGREIGYVLSKEYWGRGLMTEAVKEVIRYAFEVENYDFLLCSHFNYNDRSRRVIEKSGFEFYCERIGRGADGSSVPGRIYVLRNPAKIRNRERSNL